MVNYISPSTVSRLIKVYSDEKLSKEMKKFHDNQDLAFMFSLDRVQVTIFVVYSMSIEIL